MAPSSRTLSDSTNSSDIHKSPTKHYDSQRRSLTSHLPSAQALHFDIDKYLNRIVVQNQCRRLPRPVARWFGHRPEPVQEVGNLLIAFWALVGGFLGLTVVGAVYKYAPGVTDLQPPVLFASLGATAILEYNTIQSPLGQPRASIGGHALSSIIGVSIAKLFMLRADFDSIRWLAGAVACGIASAAMTLTNTVHPPGGATAVLAVITPDIAVLGWWFPPLISLGAVLMLVVGLVVNNIQRQFPQFWWTPRDVKRVRKTAVDEETPSEIGSEATHVEQISCDPQGLQRSKPSDAQLIIIGPNGLVLPEGFSLGPEEQGVVQILQERLRTEYAYLHRGRNSSSSDGHSDTDSDAKSDEHDNEKSL